VRGWTEHKEIQMRRTHHRLIQLMLAGILPCLAAGASTAAAVEAPKASIHFEPNRGQSDPRIRFLTQGSRHGLFVTDTGLVMKVVDLESRPKGRSSQRPKATIASVSMDFVGGRAPSAITGLDPLPGVSNYLVGHDSRWRKDVPHFGRVKMEGVYRGIDVLLHTANNQMEYDFLVAAGVDPAAIRLKLSGAKDARIAADGALEIETAAGTVRQQKPIAYQELGGARREVAAQFRRFDNGEFGFTLGKYDTRQPLVIDPTLIFSKRLVGSSTEYINDIAVDASLNVYATGLTTSLDFPTTTGAYDRTFNGDQGGEWDAFITKYNKDGGVVYSTYFGGGADDMGRAISVDSGGKPYIVGGTNSTNMPYTKGFHNFGSGNWESFIAVLNSDGKGLFYSSYFGAFDGPTGAELLDVVVKSSTEVWFTGSTESEHLPVPINGFQTAIRGNWDGFIMRVNPTVAANTQVNYFTYYGGSNYDYPNAIALHPTAGVVVAGTSWSEDLPVTRTFGPPHIFGETNDPFYIKCTGKTVRETAVFFGGSDTDWGMGVGTDSAGNTYVSGLADSSDFPLANAALGHQGGGDFFVTKFNANDTALVYSTYLGGSGSDGLANVALSVTGNGIAYVVGGTTSQDVSTSRSASQRFFGGGSTDGLFYKLDVRGGVAHATYLGGSASEDIVSVAARDGSVFTAGWTDSYDFPSQGPAPADTQDGVWSRFRQQVLFVVGNTTLNSGDLAIKNRLTGTLGLEVKVVSPATWSDSDPDGVDLIIFSATVDHNAFQPGWMKSMNTPMVVLEPQFQDDLGMTPGGSSLGTASATQLRVVLSDPLSAGLAINTNHTVVNSSQTVNWGKPAAAAKKVARLTSDTTKFSIYRYDANAILSDSTAAAGRRVGFFLNSNTAAALNANGQKLLDAAIKWAIGF
jgi:hypothetical protein